MMEYVDSDIKSHDHLPTYAVEMVYYSLFSPKCKPTTRISPYEACPRAVLIKSLILMSTG